MTAPARGLDRAQQAKTRWAQIQGGGMRSNAPASASPAQGGPPGPSASVAPAGGAGPVTNAMDPGIPGVPPVYPMVTGAPGSLDESVGRFQNYAASGVKAYGDMAGQDFRKSVGNLLGDLNGIGGLRSGGVESGVNDLTTNYARQIGDYASMAAGRATEAGQDEYDRNIERKYRAQSDARARHANFLKGVGQLLGAGLSLIPNPYTKGAGAVLSAVSK